MGQIQQLMTATRFLIHLAARELRPVEFAEIYYLEAEGETTQIRLRSPSLLVDSRSLGELEPLLLDLEATSASLGASLQF